MKKISLSLLALAAGLAAFRSQQQPVYYFRFNEQQYAPTLWNVQDEARWIAIPAPEPCGNERVRACCIAVSREHVRGSVLLPTANITAQESARDTAFVTGGFILRWINKK